MGATWPTPNPQSHARIKREVNRGLTRSRTADACAPANAVQWGLGDVWAGRTPWLRRKGIYPASVKACVKVLQLIGFSQQPQEAGTRITRILQMDTQVWSGPPVRDTVSQKTVNQSVARGKGNPGGKAQGPGAAMVGASCP